MNEIKYRSALAEVLAGTYDSEFGSASYTAMADALIASPVLAQMKKEWQAEALRQAGQDFLVEHAGWGGLRAVRVRGWLFDRAEVVSE